MLFRSEAALDSHGVAIAPEFLVRADLQNGRLLNPFAKSVPQPGAWYLICREERRDDPRIVWFEQWIAAQFARA